MLSKASKEHRLVIPVSFSLIENGRVTILIKNECKLELLKQGILNPRQLITGSRTSDHNQLRGRGPLSSIPLEEKRGVRMVGKHCMRGGEAVSKALGVGLRIMSPFGVKFHEVEILPDRYGKPHVDLHGRAAQRAQELGLTEWSVSLTHEKEYAVAFVVATSH